MMKRTYPAYALLALFALLAVTGGCGTDAEGPVTRPFHESGWYSPEAGETERYLDTFTSISMLEIPFGIGESSTLKLGEIQGVVYTTLLMQFSYDSLVNFEGMTVDSVILDLPVPAGFAIDRTDFEAVQASGKIAKFQVTPRNIVVYLREIGPTKPMQLRYRLRPTMPVRITVPPARVYEYYDPSKQGFTAPTRLAVVERI